MAIRSSQLRGGRASGPCVPRRSLGTRCKLRSDSADEALEIVCFQTGHAGGMIGGRTALFEDLDIAAGPLSNTGQHRHEILARNTSRAAAGDEDAAWLQQIDRDAIDAMIRP